MAGTVIPMKEPIDRLNLPQATRLQPLPTLRVWARQAGFSRSPSRRAEATDVGARQLVRNHEPVLALPRTHGLGVVERNSFRFFPAVRLARSNGTNGTEKTE